MKRNIHNLIWDCIVFLPCLLGLYFLDETVKKIYILNCFLVFLQMEVLFYFLKMKQSIWRDMGAVLWLTICHYMYPKTAVLSGNRRYLCLVLFFYIFIQIFRSVKSLPRLKKLGNTLLYVTNFAICFDRYIITLFLLLLYANGDAGIWYTYYSNYQMKSDFYLIVTVAFTFVLVIFKWMTHHKIKNTGVSDCVMYASVYDCIELYNLPRLMVLHMELTILTSHVAKQLWMGSNRMQGTYIGRYSVDLWEHAKDLPNKTCVLYWNSKKDGKRSWEKASILIEFIEELEQHGCNIAIVDTYSGKKVCGKANSIAAYLRKYFPYYYCNEMEDIILSVKREKETYRGQLIQVMNEIEGMEAEKQQMMQPLLQQLTGNITSSVRCFYALMKICEIVIHTEALGLLEVAENVPRNIEKPSMGTFAQLLNRDERITRECHAQLIESVRFIDCAMVRNGKSQVKTSEVSYYIICEKLVNLRNRMIGHGTMVYSVSEEIVENLARITLFLLQRYSQKKFKLEQGMTIQVQEKDVPCICEDHGHICLYNGIEPNGIILYLDYATGNTIRSQFGRVMRNQAVEVSACQEYMEETA